MVNALVNGEHDVRVARLHAEGHPLQPGFLQVGQQFLGGQVGADAVHENPRHVVELAPDELVGQLVQPVHADVGAVVQHADLLGAVVAHQVLPLVGHVLGRAAAPLLGHNALGAEGAAVRAPARGEDAEGAGAVHVVGGRLEVGVALHLEEVVSRPRQVVQVGNGRVVGGNVHFAVVGAVGDAEDGVEQVGFRVEQVFGGEVRVGLLGAVNYVQQLDPDRLALAAHHDVNLGPHGALLAEHAGVRPADDDGHARQHLFDELCRAPGLLDLGGVGGDAHHVGAILAQEVGQGFVLDVGVVDFANVATPLGHGAQVGQSEVWRGARVNGQAKLRVDQQNTQGSPPRRDASFFLPHNTGARRQARLCCVEGGSLRFWGYPQLHPPPVPAVSASFVRKE